MAEILSPSSLAPLRSRSHGHAAPTSRPRSARPRTAHGRREQFAVGILGAAHSGGRSAVRTRGGRDALGRYRDSAGRVREVIARRRRDGCLLVVDRDARTGGDGRLVAQIEAEEPTANAALVCALYLRDSRRGSCRRLTVEDLTGRAPAEKHEEPSPFADGTDVSPGHDITATDACYRLELRGTELASRELRWCRRSRVDLVAPTCAPICLRELIGAIESYEPALELTRTALGEFRTCTGVSTTVLRAELERLSTSPIVLNGGLRRRVLAAVEHGELSLSEIAIRCGRVKRDRRGNTSGETSWLARRLGMLPESGSARRTPWIHSDVLALIARNGLGITPREVELG